MKSAFRSTIRIDTFTMMAGGACIFARDAAVAMHAQLDLDVALRIPAASRSIRVVIQTPNYQRLDVNSFSTETSASEMNLCGFLGGDSDCLPNACRIVRLTCELPV
jgi:hypothetical protein